MLRNRKQLLWALLILCASMALVAFAYPMYVIRPFRGQGAGELSLALAVRSWSPTLAFLATAFTILSAALLWRTVKGVWGRIGILGIGALTIGFSALSSVNVYEVMFHRIDVPEAIPASAAKLESDDMVIAIRIEGQARAYPIRMMGYHHIANDWVGGVPIVATY